MNSAPKDAYGKLIGWSLGNASGVAMPSRTRETRVSMIQASADPTGVR
jgi:hypothetical protein